MHIPNEIEIALKQLSNKNITIRKLGAQALCKLRPKDHVLQIQHAFLAEESGGVAKWLALALGEIGDDNSLPVLEGKLCNLPDNDLRHWILVACNMLRSFADTKLLKEKLLSNDPVTKKEGLILSWGNPKLSEDTIKLHRELLDNDDPNVRRWAILSLGSQSSWVPDDQVMSHLNDPDYLAQEWTEYVISSRVPIAAIPLLIRNLTCQEPRVREWAIKALAYSGNPDVPPVLINHYKTETDILCKESVIRSLSFIVNLPDITGFITECIRTETSPEIVAALIDVVARIKNLRENVAIMQELTSKIGQVDEETLGLVFNHAFVVNMPPGEKEVIDKIHASESIQKNWDFLRELPWNIDTEPIGQKQARQASSNRRRQMEKDTSEITVAILIAKKEEFRAFLPLLGPHQPVPDQETGKSSYMFTLDNQSGTTVKVVALFVGEMGPGRSALWTKRLNERWSPDIFVNIGIAGGIHDDVMLGDVVIGTQVDNYLENAKAQPRRRGLAHDFSFSGDPFKTDRFLTNVLQQMEFSHCEAFKEWQDQGSKGLDEIPERQRIKLLRKELIRERPQVEEGHIASGQIVGAASAFVNWLNNQRDRLFLALEMESAGVALAVYEECRNTRLLVIKGISDYGDERKKELDKIGKGKIRKLAMQNATRLLIALLSKLNIGNVS
ncbi:MAG: hypothetical protein CEE38_13740 [Planctomycetes bacterium B3_Pla]|nr:MAG: hypothetical protein CEE38_13740 [Planctomycetes bacterium B3_Pla]